MLYITTLLFCCMLTFGCISSASKKKVVFGLVLFWFRGQVPSFLAIISFISFALQYFFHLTLIVLCQVSCCLKYLNAEITSKFNFISIYTYNLFSCISINIYCYYVHHLVVLHVCNKKLSIYPDTISLLCSSQPCNL